jgi:hypothetical protein
MVFIGQYSSPRRAAQMLGLRNAFYSPVVSISLNDNVTGQDERFGFSDSAEAARNATV